jgi:pyruvate formate lyase activating enzyme
MTQDGIVIDRECCQSCGTCAEACPGNAMELLGKHITAEDLYQELRKDRAFFETSNGGVTVSGGEPMIQSDFVAELLSMLKEDAIHTAIDTCGFCPSKNFDKVLPYVDLILFDLKEMDPEKHRTYTGQVNQRILDNLLVVRDFISSHNDRSLWVRTPLIPGATASEANINQIGNFIAQHLSGFVDRWELCAFNNLCRDKYRRLGMNWRYEGSSLLAKDELLEWERIAKGSGVDPEIVIATGATKVHVF